MANGGASVRAACGGTNGNESLIERYQTGSECRIRTGHAVEGVSSAPPAAARVVFPDLDRRSMTDQPTKSSNERDTARQARLSEALRENLKRRKTQLRGRARVAVDPVTAAVSTDPEPDADIRSRQPETDRDR
jgi:hypothetical protein